MTFSQQVLITLIRTSSTAVLGARFGIVRSVPDDRESKSSSRLL
ncbi:hypothetical protein PV458_30665 [Streptomyces sp. MN03-5084-2B]|nr:hypothetical protein [Streptomyces sp. MN03-5084-2B]